MQTCRDRRVENVLHMPGENLQAHARAGQKPAAPIAVRAFFQAEKNPRRPRHRAKIGKMARVDMRKNRARQRHDDPGQPRRARIEPAPRRPALHAPAKHDQVQQDGKIQRRAQRHHDKKQVRRIKHRRFEPAQERLAAIRVRIPQRHVPGAQAIGQVGAPRDEFRNHVGVACRQQHVARQREDQHQRNGGQSGHRPQRDSFRAGMAWHPQGCPKIARRSAGKCAARRVPVCPNSHFPRGTSCAQIGCDFPSAFRLGTAATKSSN